jgi:hypothetical protein
MKRIVKVNCYSILDNESPQAPKHGKNRNSNKSKLSRYKAKLQKIRAMSARITTLDYIIFGIAMAGMILAAVEADIFFVSLNSNHLILIGE